MCKDMHRARDDDMSLQAWLCDVLCRPAELPMDFPHHSDIDASNIASAFKSTA